MHDFLLFGCMIKQTESAADSGRVIAQGYCLTLIGAIFLRRFQSW